MLVTSGCDLVLGLEEKSGPRVDAISPDGTFDVACPSDDFTGTTITGVWGTQVVSGGVTLRQADKLVFDLPQSTMSGQGSLATAKTIASLGRIDVELVTGPVASSVNAGLILQPAMAVPYAFEVTSSQAQVRFGASTFVVAPYGGGPIKLSVHALGADLVFTAGGTPYTFVGAGTIAGVRTTLLARASSPATASTIEWDNFKSTCP